MALLDKLNGFGLLLLVPLVALVGGLLLGGISIVAGAWLKIRRAELTAELKQDMLNRGMSADEIRTVIEAGDRANLLSARVEEARLAGNSNVH